MITALIFYIQLLLDDSAIALNVMGFVLLGYVETVVLEQPKQALIYYCISCRKKRGQIQ